MAKLSGDLIRHKLSTFICGQNVVYTAQTGSTNTELKGLARGGAPEGLLYITEEQLAGRGRLDRSWYAPAGSSLLMSLLFRPGQEGFRGYQRHQSHGKEGCHHNGGAGDEDGV